MQSILQAVIAFFDGKKTYTGLIVVVLGLVGVSRYFGTDAETEHLVNLVLELGGLVFSAYGRYKATK